MISSIPRLKTWTLAALGRLRHAYLPRQLLIDGEIVTPVGGGSGRSAEVLVARARSLYMSVDAAGIPHRQRNDFAALAVKRAAPFSNPCMDIAWNGDLGMAWYWPPLDNEATASLEQYRSRFVSEARFLGIPRTTGTELLTISRGFLGRVWKAGHLVAERWWPQSPQPAQWNSFLRGAAVPPSPVPMTGAPLELSAAPWTEQVKSNPFRWDAITPRSVAQVVVPLSFLALVATSAAVIRAQWTTRQLEQRIDEARVAALEIVADRETAISARTEVDQLLMLRPKASPLRLLGALSTTFEGQSWQLLSMSLNERERAEFAVIAPSVDATTIVANIEASPLLENASVQAMGATDGLTISANVTPWRVPASPDEEGESL